VSSQHQQKQGYGEEIKPVLDRTAGKARVRVLLSKKTNRTIIIFIKKYLYFPLTNF
jgi:hypothetical protein